MLLSIVRRWTWCLGLLLGLALSFSLASAAPRVDNTFSGVRPQQEAFVDAAATGNRDILQRFLDSGLDVDVRNSKGMTALMAAAMNGWPEIVTMLHEAGANLDARDARGYTVMELARIGNQLFIVDLLQRLGATDSKWSSELIKLNNRL